MNHSKVLASFTVAVLLLLLQACAGLTANTISEGADKHLGLKGHDPVAYFTDAKHMLGDANIKTEYDGVIYRFVSEDHKKIPAGSHPNTAVFAQMALSTVFPGAAIPIPGASLTIACTSLAAKGRNATGRWTKSVTSTWVTNIGAMR